MLMIKRWGRWALAATLLALAIGQQLPAQAEAPPAPAAVAPLTPPGPQTVPDAPQGCVPTTRTFTQNTVQAIHDFSTITGTLPVSGLGEFTWNVTAHTAISHTYPGDLDIHLVGPNSFSLPNALTTGNGSGNDNVFADTVWGDLAAGGVTEVSFVNGANRDFLIPEGAMGSYYAHNPNGLWKLIVTDRALSDTGSLNSWSVTITTLPFMPIGASQYRNNNHSQAIPDLGTITSTIMVSTTETVLSNVTANVVIPHPRSGDLRIVLEAPGGLTTTLSNQRGGANSDQFDGTIFTDDPVTNNIGPVTDDAYVDGQHLGQVQPEGAMRHFAGINPNGAWTLIVSDLAGGETGSLTSWQLGVEMGHCEVQYLPLARR